MGNYFLDTEYVKTSRLLILLYFAKKVFREMPPAFNAYEFKIKGESFLN